MGTSEELSLNQKWRDAFFEQARTDLDAYEALAYSGLPACHQLHYLQMFLEKLSKSHLWESLSPEFGQPEFVKSHNVIAKVLPRIVNQHLRRTSQGQLSGREFEEIRQICRELDLLAPALDDSGRRPDNCEYPWARFDVDGSPIVQTPRQWHFPILNRLRNQLGRKLMKAAISNLRPSKVKP